MLLTHLRRNVVAYLALFVALGGTSYAAVSLPKDSVTSKQIKNGSVKTVDLARGVAVSGPAGPAGPAGTSGPAGPVGPTGSVGPQGAVGPTWSFQSPNDAGTQPYATAPFLVPMGTLTVPSAGRLLVWASGALSPTCSSGTPRAGLYVDGVPVAGTGVDSPATVALQGLSAPVSAGQHVFALGVACSGGGQIGSLGSSNKAGGAVLVGS
jgi:hypothetical protein